MGADGSKPEGEFSRSERKVYLSLREAGAYKTEIVTGGNR